MLALYMTKIYTVFDLLNIVDIALEEVDIALEEVMGEIWLFQKFKSNQLWFKKATH